MHRWTAPVVEVVASRRARALEGLGEVTKLSGEEASLPVLGSAPQALPPPGVGSFRGGVAGLRKLVVCGSAGACPPPVPGPTIAIEGVPGLVAGVPVRSMPPVLLAVPGVEMRREPAVDPVPHGVGAHGWDLVARRVEQRKPQPAESGRASQNPDVQSGGSGL